MLLHIMDMYELQPYRLAGEHVGKWALTIMRLSSVGIDEQPFHGGPIFESKEDALRYGVSCVRSRGGAVRRTVLQRVRGLT
jgi:hypothetical protein